MTLDRTLEKKDATNRVQPLPAAPPRGPGRLRAYVLGWAVLALAALLYLGTLAFWPDLLARSGEDADLAQAQRTASKALADSQALRQSVAHLQIEMARLRGDVRASEDLGKGLLQRVAALEERSPQLPAAAEPVPASTGPAIKKAAEPAKGAEQRQKPNGAEAKASSSDRLETGSVATPAAAAAIAPAADSKGGTPVAFGPASVKTAQPVGIQIASGPSVDALRQMWSLLSDTHPDPLKGMETRYRASPNTSKPGYDLVAGPIQSQAEARKVCKDLQSRGVACRVAAFAGEAL